MVHWSHLNGYLMVFCPKILGGGRDLQIIFLHENACSFSGGYNLRWWGHSNPTHTNLIHWNIHIRKGGQKHSPKSGWKGFCLGERDCTWAKGISPRQKRLHLGKRAFAQVKEITPGQKGLLCMGATAHILIPGHECLHPGESTMVSRFT